MPAAEQSVAGDESTHVDMPRQADTQSRWGSPAEAISSNKYYLSDLKGQPVLNEVQAKILSGS